MIGSELARAALPRHDARPRSATGTRTGRLVTMPVLVLSLVVSGCISNASPVPSATDSPTPQRLVSPADAGASSPSAIPPTSPSAIPPSSPSAGSSAFPSVPIESGSMTAADLGCLWPGAEATPWPYPQSTVPPAPSPSIRDADRESGAAISDAARQLGALRSYRFTVGMSGRSPIQLDSRSIDFASRGTVTRTNGLAIDADVVTRLVEANGSGAVSMSDRLLIGDGFVWAASRISGVLEPRPASAEATLEYVFTPESVVSRVVVPFGGGYRRVGEEQHDGVATVRYTATGAGSAAYNAVTGLVGNVSADLWIAVEGGYLVGAEIRGVGDPVPEATGGPYQDGFLMQLDVTNADDPANRVDLPARPLPEPTPRPGPPVDLRLEYRVMPLAGTRPGPADIDKIAVALRERLDVGERPVTVEYQGPDRITVTVCNTTSPDEDRHTAIATGQLAVVPLPAGTYGSGARPGPAPLPAVGSAIDPSLPPLAGVGRVGSVENHVDPATGQRGMMISLWNDDERVFPKYAAAHAGEFIAVVLDGVVLATPTIDGLTARGVFFVMGDFTDRQSRALYWMLLNDPLLFPLKPIKDIQVPAAN